MISFIQPAWLFALPVVVLMEWLIHRQTQPAVYFSDLSLLRDLPKGRASWWPKVLSALRVLALTSLILATAGLRLPDKKTRLSNDGISIIFALDSSGSMAEQDFLWNAEEKISRLDAAKRAFKLFVQGGNGPNGEKFSGRVNDQIGIVAFAAWPEAVCPLTFQQSILIDTLNQTIPKSGPDAGTNIGDAIVESLVRLNEITQRRKILILLSDGEHNISIDRADPPLKPRQAAQLAADLKIPIYAIDCGSIPSEADAQAVQRRNDGMQILQSVAKMTDGEWFQANNTQSLLAVYQQIDQLEKRSAERFFYRKYWDLSWWLGILSAICILALLFMRRIYPERLSI